MPEEKPLMTTLGNSAAQVLTIHRSHKKSQRDFIKSLRQKDEFFNIISHELKTPVTTIKGFSQILTDQLKDKDKKTKYFLEKINKQADKLSRLINDLLDISRIETGKLVFENKNFELENIIKHVTEELKISIKNHPISFKSNYKFWIKGDSHRIEEVLINLISNAAKYSPPKSKIKISLTEKNKMAYVEVEDFGFGIKEKDQEKVFNRFYQGKNEKSKGIAGLGLGLYISSTIVRHHGGTIGFSSKRHDKGTIFYFTLPYYKCKINEINVKKNNIHSRG